MQFSVKLFWSYGWLWRSEWDFSSIFNISQEIIIYNKLICFVLFNVFLVNIFRS